jgi:1-acyl-sn-glycerol-3-phosphate acyltransferase
LPIPIAFSLFINARDVLNKYVLAFITYPFNRKGKGGHYYARLWGKVALLANRVKVKIEGIEHLNGKGPYIFMSNHQGSYDIFALLGHLPYQFKWLAKKELFQYPFVILIKI